MAEYIEREAAIAAAFSATSLGNSAFRDVYDTVNRLRLIPAADVRPVVFCRDCKYWELSKLFPSLRVCTYVCGATFVRNAEDFCSRGEKREES